MPSPFPGMDPYLEGSIRTSFHNELASTIVRQLIPMLRPRYVALFEKRYVLDGPDEVSISPAGFQPDVAIERTGLTGSPRGTTILDPAPLRLETVMPEAAPQISVEIREVESRNLVTSIEILSPANKRGLGREKYMRKRNRILNSAVHLVEIDLCRIGARVPMRHSLPDVPYFIFLSREETRPQTEVWPVTPRDALPRIPIPLRYPDGDVALDLASAFRDTYDQCGFDLAVDYSMQPPVALTAAERGYVDDLLSNVRNQPSVPPRND